MQRPTGGDPRPPLAPTRFALSHPRAALGAWLAAVCLLTVLGLGIERHLSPSTFSVGGSESEHARALVGANFDDGATVPVLLRGPRADVKRQGRALAARLERRSGVSVLSPWASSGRSPLRPSGDTALLLLSITGREPDRNAEQAERIVHQHTRSPVKATVSGLPSLTRDGVRSSLAAVHRAETIALPMLLLALLLVFRSPLAALIPAFFGAATIGAGAGAIRLLADYVALDAFALALASMMGLALAVDYSLLMVSRLREERAEHPGGDLRASVARAAAPTARTVVVAAVAIVAAMAVAAAFSPGTGVLSAAMGVGVVTVLAAVGATIAVPAALMLTGRHLDRWALPGGAPRSHGLSGAVAGLAARKPLVGLGAAVALAALAIPAMSLDTAVPAASSLPKDSPARQDHDDLARIMGGGWAEPFEIVAVTHRGPVTTAARLAVLQRAQRSLAADPDVRAVLGPGAIASSAARLRKAGRQAVAAQRAVPRKAGERVGALDREVSAAATGVGTLRGALAGASGAAERIGAGSQKMQSGVGSLRSGLRGAGAGAARLADSVAAADRGTQDLVATTRTARSSVRDLRTGSRRLAQGLQAIATGGRDLEGRLRQRTEVIGLSRGAIRTQRQQADQAIVAAQRVLTGTSSSTVLARAALARARQILATDLASGLDDPMTRLGEDAALAGRIATAAPETEARRLATASQSISDGLGQLDTRLRDLGGSVDALRYGAGTLAEALGRLTGGAGSLGSGLSALTASVEGLARGVRDGERRSGELAGGLSDARSAVRDLNAQGSGRTSSDPAGSRTASTGFFDSGYFLLAALEGGGTTVPFGVNVDRGGQGARIVVVPRHGVDDPRTIALYERLRDVAAELRTSLDADAAVGGPAALLADYDEAANARLPLIVLMLAVVSALLLGLLLRSVVVPLLGVALNLLAVGATLGLLSLLFEGSSPLLGGPGTIDTVALTAIFGVAFALSIDYQVFIIARVREQWLAGHDEATAVRLGLAKTARVVTGAALSMVGVFAAFALADVASVRQFGVGLAIAVAIDATIIRLLLLPAALRLAGRWAWWTPRARMTLPAPAPAGETA